jgi:RNA-directed DNA polymerase
MKVRVSRCAEDCIVTGHSKMVLEHEVQPLIAQFLTERGLVLLPEKTRGTPLVDGLDLLGTNVRQYQGKLLCAPAKQNVRPFLDTIRGIGKRHKQAITGHLLLQLNPEMRGWAQ